MNKLHNTSGPTIRYRDFLEQCLSIDLEVNPKTAQVFAFAAVRHNGKPVSIFKDGLLEAGLDLLEQSIDGFAHPIGHNFLQHDLAHLVAARPRLAKMMQAPVDTLWLNPLAFPRNPYHHLVKHYRDGQLLDLSRFGTAPRARLSRFPFESDGAFPAQC